MATTAAMSDYLEGQLANHVLRNISFTSPATIRLALFKSPVTPAELEAGTLTNEVSSGIGYTRQAVTFGAPSSPGGVTTNSGQVTFSAATAPWGTVTHWAIMDSATIGAGNVLVYGDLDNSKVVDTDDIFQVPASNLAVTFA